MHLVAAVGLAACELNYNFRKKQRRVLAGSFTYEMRSKVAPGTALKTSKIGLETEACLKARSSDTFSYLHDSRRMFDKILT